MARQKLNKCSWETYTFLFFLPSSLLFLLPFIIFSHSLHSTIRFYFSISPPRQRRWNSKNFQQLFWIFSTVFQRFFLFFFWASFLQYLYLYWILVVVVVVVHGPVCGGGWVVCRKRLVSKKDIWGCINEDTHTHTHVHKRILSL